MQTINSKTNRYSILQKKEKKKRQKQKTRTLSLQICAHCELATAPEHDLTRWHSLGRCLRRCRDPCLGKKEGGREGVSLEKTRRSRPEDRRPRSTLLPEVAPGNRNTTRTRTRGARPRTVAAEQARPAALGAHETLRVDLQRRDSTVLIVCDHGHG